MVTYRQWVSILFEIYGDTNESTEIMRVAGREWSAQKEAFQNATMAEAREYARRHC